MLEKLISKSRVTEIDDVGMRMIAAYKNTSLNSDSHLNGMFTDLETATTTLSDVINRSLVESDLEAKNKARETEVRALNYLIKGNLYHPDAAIEAAAQTVNKVFKNYGLRITRESYASESALITSLLGDLSGQVVQDAIALLSGCAETIAALKTAQTEFETARVAYEEEKAQEGTMLNATTVKNEVLDVINKRIVVYLRAMQTVDEEAYGAFALTVAQIIADNNEVVKKRAKKKEEEAKEELLKVDDANQ